MSNKSGKVIVVKIGGSTFGGHDTTIEDIVYLQEQGERLIVVHGGANTVTNWLKRQGTPTKFVHGERVTDEKALEMIIAVLGGLVNKEIVAAINCRGGKAVGITGVDGALLRGKMRNRDMGYVGDVVEVDTAVLDALMKAGFVPIIAPVSLYSFDRDGEMPLMLNINGDTVAGEIAAAMSAEKVIFLTDVAGINDKSGKLLTELTIAEAERLMASGVASGGMIPKIKACLKALSDTSVARIINGKEPHALRMEIEGKSSGTVIRSA